MVEAGDKILRFGISARPRDLVPHRVQDETTFLILSQVFETVVLATDPEAPVQPVLFSGPMVSEVGADGRERWTGTVRSDVVFSDGAPLTAEAMAACFRGHQLPARFDIEVSGNQIRFVLERRNPNFPLLLSSPYFVVYRETSAGLFGTGPFRLVEASANGDVYLERNALHRDPVRLDGVHFVHLPPGEDGRSSDLLAGFESGAIHMTDALSRDEAHSLHHALKSFQPGNSTALLFLNCERLADPHLRRAIAHAIDRRDLARQSYDNALSFAASGVQPPMFGPIPDGFRFSPDEARRELALSRQPMPPRLSVLQVWGPRSYLPHPSRTLDGIAGHLAVLGTELVARSSEGFDDFYDACQQGDFDLALAGWVTDTPEPADFLEAVLASQSVPDPGQPPGTRFNLGRYRNPAMDRAIASFRDDHNVLARNDIRQLLGADAPVVGLIYGPSVVVVQPNVRGYQPLSVGFHRLGALDLA